MKLMALLMLAFAIAVGYATFAENSYDTATAKILVYNATWFEMMLFVLMINLIGGMFVNKVFKKEKLSILIFHLSFILILLGAGISRFFGYEGQMVIPEGESSNEMYTAEPYLQVQVGSLENFQATNGLQYEHSEPRWLSEATPGHNSFDLDIKVPGKKPLNIKYKDYRKDIVYDVSPGNGKGAEYILLNVPRPNGGGMDTVYLKNGSIRDVQGIPFAFNNASNTSAVQFFTRSDGGVDYKAPYDVYRLDQDKIKANPDKPPMSLRDTLSRDEKHELKFRQVHFVGESVSFVYKAHFDDAILDWKPARREGTGRTILFVDLNYGNQHKLLTLNYSREETTTYHLTTIGDMVVRIGYGPKVIYLPFYVENKDFRMVMYEQSTNPASYECDLAINDPGNDTYLDATIYMNNVLDYGGYRFFQSSYSYSNASGMDSGQPDITILSVNHDMAGTIVTYIGYILMALGFIWSLFNKHSRFTMLRRKLKEAKNKRSGLTILMLLISVGSFASTGDGGKDEFFKEAKSLLVMEFKGRISPLQTHARDVLYKLKKKSSHTTLDGRSMNALEAYISMIGEPEKWYMEKVLFVKEESVQDLLGIEGKYTSLYDMLDTAEFAKGRMRLRQDLSDAQREAHLVRDADKSKLHKGVLKLYDNASLFITVLGGNRFWVYPVELSDTEVVWINHEILKNNIYDGVDVKEVAEMDKAFFSSLRTGLETDDFSESNKVLQQIKQWQRAHGENLPSETAVKMEVLYNDVNIFFKLLIIYTMLGLVLLVLLNLGIFYPNNVFINRLIRIFFWVAVVCTAFHALGLALRWYVVGHAPWSNGYEALVFISFVAMIAGIIFYKSSRFAIGATTVLTGLILGVAHGASVDPELTNLQPVLKSVWLVIHVAIITSSYAFLGLGAILALENIFLTVFRTKRSASRINSVINEITTTAELTMTIGLYMAAIGTFLGGVWANESWGRYWGWDAKETWALVIVLTYSLILHMRFIPFLKSRLVFNVAAVVGFGTVIMTYFGVNYYLTKGLHSYAQGDGATFLPPWARITVALLLVLITIAFVRNSRYKKDLIKQ